MWFPSFKTENLGVGESTAELRAITHIQYFFPYNLNLLQKPFHPFSFIHQMFTDQLRVGNTKCNIKIPALKELSLEEEINMIVKNGKTMCKSLQDWEKDERELSFFFLK